MKKVTSFFSKKDKKGSSAPAKKEEDDWVVSKPFNLQQRIHVDFNSNSGFTVRYFVTSTTPKKTFQTRAHVLTFFRGCLRSGKAF